MEALQILILSSLGNLLTAAKYMALPAVAFLCLAIIFKGRTWIEDVRRAAPETGLNIKIMAFNILVTGPIAAVVVTFLQGWLQARGLVLFTNATWQGMPVWLVLFLAVFVGDFFHYWRHRLDHSALLWPAHAVHHSDTEVNWTTSVRWHPINILTMRGVGGVAMLVMGFPAVAILFNSMARGYYGYFIHADLPWTYGKLGRWIVSPAMHRWHHAMEREAWDKNFAEFFCIFDRMFGTFYLPGPCNGPLGVPDEMKPTLGSQLAYPFRPTAYRALAERLGLTRPGRIAPGE